MRVSVYMYNMAQGQRRDVRRSCILRPLTDLKHKLKAEEVVVQGEDVGIGGRI